MALAICYCLNQLKELTLFVTEGAMPKGIAPNGSAAAMDDLRRLEEWLPEQLKKNTASSIHSAPPLP